MPTVAPVTFYRIVKTDPPTIADCTPQAQLGRRLVDASPEKRHLSRGLSVFATEAQAHRQSRAYPVLGGFIAELHIPAGVDAMYSRTLSTPGHHTLWAAPALLLSCAIRVVPARRSP